jgi:hypothetical protein
MMSYLGHPKWEKDWLWRTAPRIAIESCSYGINAQIHRK